MCHQRTRGLAEDYPHGAGLVTKVEHTLSWAGAAPAGYFTAMLAGERHSGGRAGADYDAAFLRERARQAQWLRAQLNLSG
jgi:hypothetical protein